MRETELIDYIRKIAARGPQDTRIVKGIGDDCAILRPAPNEDLVFTSDFVLQGRHFTLETHSAADIGHKALARSLSDLAAMGSEPVFCLVSLAVPSISAKSFVTGFYKGLRALAARYKVAIAGGDLARFDKVIADVICCGRVKRGKAMLRRAAKPGDRIFVTGALGGSAEGFLNPKGKNFRRHLRPEPRIQAGLALRGLGVKAAIDLSDGLSLDLRRMCIESQVSAAIDSDLPIAPGANLQQALHDGEDYELLFTGSPRLKIPRTLEGITITCIGAITAGRPGRVTFQGSPLKPGGFDHFE